ncbi:MAG: redoxin domain-containing protein [Candidatus Poribacteria bacterium]|nr:redoxin domain-containing protein [Candidatus Poribacteria bacterium]
MANVGSTAPDFTLTGAVNQDDVEVSLSDYAGKNLVVLFYPLAFSPVCAEQVPDFNEKLGAIQAKNAEVIAINRDSTFAHKAWSKELGGVDFPLLADMNLGVSKEFGMALEEVGITTRGVFIIDGAGNIAFKHVEAAPPENTLTADQVLGELDKLQ